MGASDGVDAYVQEIIEQACKMSEITCEVCGMTGAKTNESGWLTTLCDKCRSVNNKEAE